MADRDCSTVTARILSGAAELSTAEWDACAGKDNPFTTHAFIRALEESGSATAKTGWAPRHLVIDGADGRATAILPGYLKSHSMGEYVFDHAWAHAYERMGGSYYPKYQISVPFTPASGPRLLLRDPALAPALTQAGETLTRQFGLSSAHATFIDPAQRWAFESAGWLIREDQQFHWTNDGYSSFDDFLAALASRKRKAIRKEREAALAGGLTVKLLTGGDLTEAAWDAFWVFYQDTGSRKWGRPYLTRKFFSLVGELMADRTLLIMAYRGSRPIAGALNFIGADALYGRNWGCAEDVPFLHFELCYYQAIDWAVAHGLKRVEAGAQGEHKLARGYLPVPTVSAHFVPDLRFRAALADYLERERAAVAAEIDALTEMGPFRRAADPPPEPE
ncbi:MAG: GNAT family N-acetyltransferase [Sphingomonadaceae bacterium]|nr:GNAT family N-acetyltransferase [Sphingomonadaceae bacterium]